MRIPTYTWDAHFHFLTHTLAYLSKYFGSANIKTVYLPFSEVGLTMIVGQKYIRIF